ncbi:hypothetical protein [Lentzea sp. NEAU-D7]|uniref:hypothetical protein n=1 Tax=Lentzea sp. NEAU-D7 TaxID=2994667 RepID=UPI00224A7F5A|nr:hypothetical protein [Lentzea sp. NEAU-D7]MCX2951009.1 hypothetical protein [Lentzea sp. NEAU-D7]
MRSRLLIYFGSVLAVIALINTSAPKIIVSAVLNPEAGEAVARSLSPVTRDLVLVLLVSIYFEWARNRSQGELLRSVDLKIDEIRDDARSATAPSTRKLVLDSTGAEELVTLALDRHAPNTGDKTSFIAMVLSQRPVYDNVSVALRVDGVDGETVHVSNRFEATMRRGPILIAATRSPPQSAALSAACPELFEVTALPRSTPFDEAVEAFGRQLECYVTPPGGGARRVGFRKVPTDELHRHLSPPVGIAASDIALFAADLSQEKTDLVRVRHHFRWTQKLDEHFIYWYADRPMFISSLTVDVRETMRKQYREVWVQAHLGGVDSLMLDADEGYLSLRLNRWVVQGHGVTAIW